MNRICLTMGDPAGVGPELIIQLLGRLQTRGAPGMVIAGDCGVLKLALEKFGNANARRWFRTAAIAERERLAPDIKAPLVILNLSELSPKKLRAERAGKKHGLASWKYIAAGARLCRLGACGALVTLPVNKESLLQAGCPYPGHTDLLAALDRAERAVMLMVLGKLRVALVTHHLPLKQVPAKIEPGTILSILKVMQKALKTDFGLAAPKIGVLGLNPHAGEQGKIGVEEIEKIIPAIRQARKAGIDASGPWPADTAFHRARSGEFDALLAMYHDQGIGPLKTLEFERVVNVTLGLSFVRTSPGHGTAYEVAWTGKASGQSLLEAFRLARQLSANRKRSNG